MMKSKWSTRKALKLIIEWKESRPCCDCHLFYRYFQIEADHVPERGKKIYVLGSRQARKLDEATLRRELAKCDAVCRNCHSFRGDARRRRSGFRPALPRTSGRGLPPGASVTPWTKTLQTPQEPRLSGGRFNSTQGAVQSRPDLRTPAFSRISR